MLFNNKVYKTNDVYGISRDLPLNYIKRQEVDQKLIENLDKKRHIVIYGSSKQGKTSLKKSCLKSDEYINIQCFNHWKLTDIHLAILKQAGYQTTQSVKQTASGKQKVAASFEGIVNFFGLAGSKGAIAADTEQQKTTETLLENFDVDPDDVNDIIACLNAINFQKYIVLEDFHYLDIDIQRDFAVVLKAFHEASKFCFIIIGVWLEENRLIVHNGDLTGRVIAVDADKWTYKELMQVIDEGAKLLNINFTVNFKNTVIKESYGSVYIVQEVCSQACDQEQVKETQSQSCTIGDRLYVHHLIKSVVDQQNGRYISFINQFSEGFQDTQLEMYKWILYPILSLGLKELQQGITYTRIRDTISV
ncbi:hypothetical protein [Nostoc sp.]|uniref:hypothetical protein n=1 Tax=Nostoc sp. TaxID=1180 RepID=UPI002FF7E91D